jgi:hypothetical protein
MLICFRLDAIKFDDLTFLVKVLLMHCYKAKDLQLAFKILIISRKYYLSQSFLQPCTHLSNSIGDSPIWKYNEFWEYVYSHYSSIVLEKLEPFAVISLICQSMLGLNLSSDYATIISINLCTMAKLPENELEDLLVLVNNMAKGT